MTLTILGQCPSGKNQVQLLWRNGKVHRYPNKTFKAWREDAVKQWLGQTPRVALGTPVSLLCTYWPGDRRVRDVPGQIDAIFSLLVYARVLKNDGLVWNVTWKRMELSKFPKVCLEMAPWIS